MPMNPRVFREYDIRGVAESDFPDDFVADLGRAIGAYFADAGARRITLGRDCRHLVAAHPRRLQARAARRRASTSIDVGVVHTPGALLLGLSPGRRRRRDDHRQPQPVRGQRLQDRLRQEHHLRRRDPEAARADREARVPSTGDVAARARPPSTTSCSDYVAYIADNIKLGPRRDQGGRRRRQRHRRPGAAADPRDAGRRRRRALLRARRPLPQPPPRPDRAREPGRPHRAGAADRRRGGHRARRRRRSDRRRRRPGRILWGDQLVMLFARDILDAAAGRHLRQRGEVQPGAVRRASDARAARPSCGRWATRSSRRR